MGSYSSRTSQANPELSSFRDKGIAAKPRGLSRQNKSNKNGIAKVLVMVCIHFSGGLRNETATWKILLDVAFMYFPTLPVSPRQ